ncbi:MAG TPA: hypothetical protein EYH30_07145 [Anaerolineales bacterium]|nr:hypothetical protein [Anaerolineales bacterium]
MGLRPSTPASAANSAAFPQPTGSRSSPPSASWQRSPAPLVSELAPNVYRLRIGPYRVIYRVFDEEQVILIGRIARRSEGTYRDWEDLFG